MKTVGVKELKAKLSSYIHDTRKGEKIVVTDHGEEVALLSPLSTDYKLMVFLEKSGKAHWTRGKPEGLDEPIEVKGKPLSTTILEERE
jgi:prevent-host-death family protein